MSDGSRAPPRVGALGGEPKAFQLLGTPLMAIFVTLNGYLCDLNGHLCDAAKQL